MRRPVSDWRDEEKIFFVRVTSRDLKVWRKAHELTQAIYQVASGFPRAETYGLTSQLRRSSASIPANIAEGCARMGDAEFARFCFIAMGSASELEYHILLVKDLR